MLGGETLEEIVRVTRETDGEQADFALLAGAVEDDDALRALSGDVAGKQVDELQSAKAAADKKANGKKADEKKK